MTPGTRAKRNRRAGFKGTVYVIGAGFSAGLGYPLTKNLLIDVWGRLDKGVRKQLSRIIEFHHPSFTTRRKTTFPEIEQLITEIAINLDLFDASRPAEGAFTMRALRETRDELLSAIANWFHELYPAASSKSWLLGLTERLRAQRAAIVSFNWDLLLDGLLFGDALGPSSYGLTTKLGIGPVLLKPHGSLNWYPARQVKRVPTHKHVTVFTTARDTDRVDAFLPPRAIRSKSDKRYTPLIVAPTYLKDFNKPVFRHLWRQCTEVLSTARTIVFLGYSMPAADLHAQFIFRCGFHNQVEGRLRERGGRHRPTGRAKVIIVNPDHEAAMRIEAVVGQGCVWVAERAQSWIERRLGTST